MKKITISLMLLFLMSICLSAQTRIAVYVSGILSENYNTLLGDNLVETFAESNQYIAVNRSAALNSILKKAQSIQENGHIDYTQVVSATKQYGESQLCAVNVIEIDYMYVFRASLLDVLTNTVIKTASAEAPKSEIGYTKILEIAQRLSARLISDAKQASSDFNSLKATTDVALARKRVEENRKYDISYAEFQYDPDKYVKGCPAARHYMDVRYNLNVTGGMLLGLLGGGAIMGAGLGYGLNWSKNELEKKVQVRNMLCCMVAGVIPGIVLLSVAPAYEKKAWRECRKSYDDAVKDLEKARKYQSRASLELAPAVGYDWAGLSLKLKFN